MLFYTYLVREAESLVVDLISEDSLSQSQSATLKRKQSVGVYGLPLLTAYEYIQIYNPNPSFAFMLSGIIILKIYWIIMFFAAIYVQSNHKEPTGNSRKKSKATVLPIEEQAV